MVGDFCTFTRGASELMATTLVILVGGMEDVKDKDIQNATLVLMYIFRFVSGAHANPCVSISCYFMGYLASKLMLMYVVCQVLGAGLGYLLLMRILPQEGAPVVCQNEPLDSLSSIQIVAIEWLLTAVNVLGYCALWDIRSCGWMYLGSLRRELLVTACSFVGVQLTGGSINPVKTLVQGNSGLICLQLTGQVLASIMMPKIWQNAYMPCYRSLQKPIQI
ncbi:hypothetical protein KR059_002503, partial [Drosophila kikkawai]